MSDHPNDVTESPEHGTVQLATVTLSAEFAAPAANAPIDVELPVIGVSVGVTAVVTAGSTTTGGGTN